jgi:hypothetical protein
VLAVILPVLVSAGVATPADGYLKLYEDYISRVTTNESGDYDEISMTHLGERFRALKKSGYITCIRCIHTLIRHQPDKDVDPQSLRAFSLNEDLFHEVALAMKNALLKTYGFSSLLEIGDSSDELLAVRKAGIDSLTNVLQVSSQEAEKLLELFIRRKIFSETLSQSSIQAIRVVEQSRENAKRTLINSGKAK